MNTFNNILKSNQSYKILRYNIVLSPSERQHRSRQKRVIYPMVKYFHILNNGQALRLCIGGGDFNTSIKKRLIRRSNRLAMKIPEDSIKIRKAGAPKGLIDQGENWLLTDHFFIAVGKNFILWAANCIYQTKGSKLGYVL